MKALIGMPLRGCGGLLIGVGAVGVVLGVLLVVFDSDPEVRQGGAIVLGAGLVGGGLGWLFLRFGRAVAPLPEVLFVVVDIIGALWLIVVKPIGLRLSLAVAGAGTIVGVVVTDQRMPVRLLGIALGGFFLALFMGVLVTDIRLRRWRWVIGNQPPITEDLDHDGRPTATEWAAALIFNGFGATVLIAGVLDLRAGGGAELLAFGVFCTVMFLVLTAGTVHRWWTSRQGRKAVHPPQGDDRRQSPEHHVSGAHRSCE